MHNPNPQIVPLSILAQALGQRLERYRIARNLKQEDLAAQAGLSRMTIGKLEAGGGATLDTLLRVLRALGLEDRLLALIPDAEISPLDPRAGQNRPRRRVRRKGTEEEDGPWTWGDDR